MHDLNDLFYFVQVVDHGGFAPASRAIGVPKSKLSRRVAGLEKRLGVRLIQRSTRSVSVTELGQAYYGHCAAMLVEAEAAQETVERTVTEPRGLVRMSCPHGLLYFQVASCLSQFMTQYPRVQIHLEASSRHVDIVKEGYDLAVRVRFPPLEDSDLNMRALSKSPQRLMASPSLFERYPKPSTPEDLRALPTLDWERPYQAHTWCLDGPDGVSTQIDHHPKLVTDDLTMLRRAALDGHGVVQLPMLIGGHDIAAGTLLDALPGWAPRGGIVHVVFPSKRGLLPSVRKLIDYLADGFGNADFNLDHFDG